MLSFPVSVLGFLFVSFRPSLLRSHSRSTGACLLLSLSAFPLLFRFLSSASFPVLTTQPFCFPFLFFPVLLYSCFPGAPSPLSLPRFSPSFRPVSMPSFRFSVLGFLSVSFRPSLLRFPQPLVRCLPFAFAFGIFRFTSAFFRPLLLRFRLLSLCFFRSLLPGLTLQWFLRCPLSALAFSVFPVPSCLVSHAVLPGFGTWLSVCFLSSFPVSLPQPFHRCFPSFPLSFVRFSSGLFCLLSLSFVRFRSLLTTQPSALSFPLFPISPGSGSLGVRPFLSSLSLSSSGRPVSMPSFRFRYSAFCISFLRFAVSPHSGYLSSWPPVSSTAIPLCFRFRFRLLGFRHFLSVLPRPLCIPAANFYILTHGF